MLHDLVQGLFWPAVVRFKNGTESPKSAAVIFPQNKPRFGASSMFNAIQNWILADEQDHTLPKKISSLISERFLDKLSLFMESPSIPQIKIIQMYRTLLNTFLNKQASKLEISGQQ